MVVKALAISRLTVAVTLYWGNFSPTPSIVIHSPCEIEISAVFLLLRTPCKFRAPRHLTSRAGTPQAACPAILRVRGDRVRGPRWNGNGCRLNGDGVRCWHLRARSRDAGSRRAACRPALG